MHACWHTCMHTYMNVYDGCVREHLTCFQFKLTCYILPTPANALIPVGPSCVGGRGNPSLLGHASFTVNCQQSGGHYTFVYVL